MPLDLISIFHFSYRFRPQNFFLPVSRLSRSGVGEMTEILFNAATEREKRRTGESQRRTTFGLKKRFFFYFFFLWKEEEDHRKAAAQAVCPFWYYKGDVRLLQSNRPPSFLKRTATFVCYDAPLQLRIKRKISWSKKEIEMKGGMTLRKRRRRRMGEKKRKNRRAAEGLEWRHGS